MYSPGIAGQLLYPISLIQHSYRFCFIRPPRWLSGKESACQCRRHRRCRFDPWSGRSLGGGNGNPLRYSYLENPIDRGAWLATVHRATKSNKYKLWSPLRITWWSSVGNSILTLRLENPSRALESKTGKLYKGLERANHKIDLKRVTKFTPSDVKVLSTVWT